MHGKPLTVGDASRRTFLKTAAAAGVALVAGPIAAQAAGKARPEPEAGAKVAKAENPLKILILGGTAFLGPELVEAARARGHTLTLFNRGITRPNLFPDIEKLRGDRDPDKGGGLKALEGRSWDAVIDTSGYFPRHAKASAELLAPKVKHYAFISTVSVYAENKTPDADETAPVGVLDDPTVETMGPGMSYYGPLKALCEQAVEKAFPGHATNIRPGFIGGPGDFSFRHPYWIARAAAAKEESRREVLAPGRPTDPVQYIDVRDLAEWTIHCVERGVYGVFNAVGLESTLSMSKFLDACNAAGGGHASYTWADAAFLDANNVSAGGDMPLWLPPDGESAGFSTRSNKKAVAAGLKFRDVETTCRDTLKWYQGLADDTKAKLATRAGLKPEREAELLKKLKEVKPG
ncbi:MAG: twin-arginine translocation signal domain-containing protein [Planctomycetota bacterium]|nr:twin-arginine translocation signal domain-containing protein [Planctomycetota bacterium]